MKGVFRIRLIPAVLTAILLSLFLLSTVFSPMTVRAEDTGSADGSGNANGVEVSTTTDKKSYKSGEKATITVSVKNTNTYDLTDVTVDYDLPDNFSVADGEETSQTVATLAAGETKEFPVTATVTEDTDAEIVESGGLNPIVIVVIVVVVIIVVAVVVGIFFKKHKNGPKSGVAAMLVLALLTSLMVAAQPQTAAAKTADGLAENSDFMRASVHDPSIVKDPSTGTYYIFGSHLAFAKSEDLISWMGVDCNVKTEWETLFAEPWEWAAQGNHGNSTDVNLNGQMWAPDVIWNDTMNKWCMYMSIDGNDWCSSICLLTADNIEGPYEYQGIVVYSGFNNPNSPTDITKTDVYQVLDEEDDLVRYKSTSESCINAIDPCVKYDENGDLYMSYGSWSAGIYMLKLDPATGLRDYSVKYETENDKSDAYFGTKIAGGYYNSGEASYLLKVGDYWYLFMSYAGLTAQGGYQIRIYRSENIDGPYVDQNGVSAISNSAFDYKNKDYGVKLFGSYEMPGITKVQVAQGHNSAFVDDDGKIYVVYHTRFQSEKGDNEMHQVRVHQMFVNEDGWLIAAPYEYTGETLSTDGYDASEVAGEYAFIYHDPLMYYCVVSGSQFGIIGSDETTTKEMSIEKDLVVAHRKAVVKCSISYTHEGSEKVVLNEDGTIGGDYTGTWKFTDGANVEMNLDGVTYKGVFLQQEDESTERNMRMTFTMLGDNVTVWGVQTNEQLGIVEEE